MKIDNIKNTRVPLYLATGARQRRAYASRRPPLRRARRCSLQRLMTEAKGICVAPVEVARPHLTDGFVRRYCSVMIRLIAQ